MKIRNIVRFFPYESVHASNPVIEIDITDEIRNDVIKELSKYRVVEYYNCADGYFNLKYDNKITLELKPDFRGNQSDMVYVTLWDGILLISSAYVPFIYSDRPFYCTVRKV